MLVDWHDPNDKKPTYKFPGVAADLLSTPNQRVIDFFSLKKGDVPLAHLHPLLEFFVDAQKNGQARFQHTRSGYICRILNSLILHRSGAFAMYLLSQMDLTPLIDACHCRSTSMTVLNLITLLSSSVQTPMMMAAPASILDKQNEAAISTIAPEVVQESLSFRKDLFKQVLVKAIASADYEGNAELHANLVWIVGQLLIKQSAERPHFVKLFNAFLPEIVDEFSRVFASPVPNRLGNLFLVALETQSKDPQATAAPPNAAKQHHYCLPDLPDHIQRLTKALVDTAEQNKAVLRDSKVTHTFSSEIGRSNQKVFKVLEALNVSLRLYIHDAHFVNVITKDSGLHHHVFGLMLGAPFNNILHNLVRRYLLLIIEKMPNDIVDLYFAKNPAFISFIDQLAASPFVPSNAARKVRQGYIGQAVSICAALREKATPENARLFESELSSDPLDELPGQVLQPGVRTGKPGARRHRLPRRQRRRLRQLLRLHFGGGQGALCGLPAPGV